MFHGLGNKMSTYAAKKMGKRWNNLDSEFRKGPKYTYWPGLSVVHAYSESGFFDVGKMEEESRKSR